METNLALFNQINSLCYWLLNNSEYRASIVLDSDEDTFSISIKHCNIELYDNCIPGFSKRNPRFLEYELDAIVAGLLHIKQKVDQLQRKAS